MGLERDLMDAGNVVAVALMEEHRERVQHLRCAFVFGGKKLGFGFQGAWFGIEALGFWI